MQTTLESTQHDDQTRERRLGSELWSKTKALLDELDRLRALQPAQAFEPCSPYGQSKALAESLMLAAKKARANHARDVRTERLHAVIDAVLATHIAPITAWTGSATSRAKFVRRLIGEKAPHYRYIMDYLETLQL